MKIAFCGDIFLGGDALTANSNNTITHPDFLEADIRIANLEQAISDSDYIENKSTLYTNSATTDKLFDLKIRAVNIANNHIHDKGTEGIIETRHHLNQLGIGCFGAGRDIDEAIKPYWVTDKLALFGYCDFDRPYLKQVAVSNKTLPGVAPLRRETILSDLQKLEAGKKAILYFHWGREHVWCPPESDIRLAEELLRDERVLLIVGMHAHRFQGYIKSNGKRAYMCIGNFLFPNFFIRPPVQIVPDHASIHRTKWVTRHYHRVFSTTYKKWRIINRLSLIVTYDTISNTATHSIAYQKDNSPIVRSIPKIIEYPLLVFIEILSLIYLAPVTAYKLIERVNSTMSAVYWHVYNQVFMARQLGVIRYTYEMYKRYIKKY